MSARILVIDDDADHCALLSSALSHAGYAPHATTSHEALELAASSAFDTILTDLDMDEMSGIDLCERMLGGQPDVPVIVVTGFGGLDTAIAAMRAGAHDFLTKPVDAKLLGIAIERAVKHRAISRELRELRAANGDRAAEPLLGTSVGARLVQDLVSRVAKSDATVLVHGETGTGKELVARAIHAESPRKDGPFVAINCAAVPASLLESELFGHERGAFTDARARRSGLFLDANGGTLFLDEIGELPLALQPKLLRALQERMVRPVGSNVEVPFDARIVAATHHDLERDSAEGRFRRDLFYRLNVVRIDVPPLRERRADVVKLAAKFIDRSQGPGLRIALSSAAAEKLVAYEWPGNVRELENCMERAVGLARHDEITVDDLPEAIRAYRPRRFVPPVSPDDVLTLDILEERYIRHVLALVEGNKSRAAALLGLDRRTLYRKLDRYKADGGPGEAARRKPWM